MSHPSPADDPIYTFRPKEVEGFDSLAELAVDMQWSWNHAADDSWRKLDPALWKITHNPWVVLQTILRDQIEGVLASPGFCKRVADLVGAKHMRAAEPA